MRREKLAMLGQLASGVGHELRNPLGVMTNAVYYLEMVQPDAPRRSGIPRHPARADRLGREDRRRPARLRAHQAAAARAGAAAAHRRRSARAPVAVDGVRIERDVGGEPARRARRSGADRQVVFNLLMNAMQAMEAQIGQGKGGGHGKDGGVLTLRGRRHPPTRPAMTLDVSDTGPGVAARAAAKIFEPLFTTKARGIGLGLAVSRSLAEANGGTLTRRARPARAPLHVDPAWSAAGARASDAMKSTILVVDDDRQMVKTLSAVLR